ncbi:solute carrier family 35 (UDP-sugar transporter), member A1/2/3, partial [Tremellales sp. Uapishka_1]
MHYSRISTSPSRTYSAATAVLLNELLKGTISMIIALKRIDTEMLSHPTPTLYSEKSSHSKDSDRRIVSRLPTLVHASRLKYLASAVLSKDCYKLSIPAILYVIQNNLQYVAASNLDVATFQVTYQMKILTTAFFSVLLLRKKLSRAKWAALFMLAMGVGIVQIQSSTAPAISSGQGVTVSKGTTALRSDIPNPDETILSAVRVMHPLTGFLAVTMACLTSGLAGVYFELILKSSSGSSPPPDLWIRNTQLSLFSLIPAIVPILVAPSGAPGAGWLERVLGSFSNFNGWALGTVLTQTLGGLITAVVIKYSDNILKGFATSLSIIISFLASVALFSYPITLAFVLGSSIVLLATYLYNSPAATDAPSTRSNIAVQPGSPIPQSAPILGEPPRPSRTSSVISLLGVLGSGSGSKKPSSTDLRHQGIYSASAPGTPYLSSPYPSSTNVHGLQYSYSPTGSMQWSPNSNPMTKSEGRKSKPELSVDVTGLGLTNGGVGR